MSYKPSQPPTGHINTKQLLAAWKASSYINVQHTYFSAFYKGRKLLLLISNVGNLWFAQANRVTSQTNRLETLMPTKAVLSEKGYPQGYPQKGESSIQGAVTHFHHGPSASLLQGTPATRALCSCTLHKMLCLVMKLMHTQWLLQRKFLFADSKWNACWKSVIHWLQNYP